MSDLYWTIDSLVVKDNVMFGFGWIFHARYEVVSLRFRVMSAERNVPEHIYADFGKSREDVGRSYLNHARAMNSGYVVFGALSDERHPDSIVLECTLADGSTIELSVPSSKIICFSKDYAKGKNRIVLRQAGTLLKRGLYLIRSGKISSFFDKVKRYLNGRPQTALQKPDEFASLFESQEGQNLSVILDHNLGGGANQYRDRLVDAIIREGRSAIILTYHVATLSHMVIVRNKRLNVRYSIPDITFLWQSLQQLSVKDIIYNTAVSFVKPDEIPQFLIRLKVQTSARLMVLAHDFYLVCPSHFLLDHDGKYCQIPEISVCDNCLPKNRYGFAALFTERDISKWRAIWGSLLAAADEIITFSNSTAQLLMKAYPQIENSQISIRPHEVAYLEDKVVRIKQTASLRIGVVGQIGFHKGAAFIQQLSREIKRREVDVNIVVIGSIEVSCEPSVVSQTGPYRYDQLASLIDASGANVMLFPSIWPETFSYVVQELMYMDLPVASFNLGAPAERIASYSKGLVLASMDAASVLDELILFHSKIYLAH
ncbi:Glycosyltransferase involved in cell wall bisynthesis [Nitrosomonas ureae]|uniref:Glycosyltransferase involved in cell wall bisynthesis n=1 Tax=Nitrosomonas ureae TaxID=44577 RepID=A0A285C0U2_9PROT|nr:glycosyltransferase [Nitrosomonas ureae]SNX61191.1 Glycosyltransferase involved in cell wall bisynthesis [Nitrosomonas ureae]